MVYQISAPSYINIPQKYNKPVFKIPVVHVGKNAVGHTSIGLQPTSHHDVSKDGVFLDTLSQTKPMNAGPMTPF